MPITPKGNKIMKAMKHEYGEKKGKSVFYASKNAGKLTGVDHGFYGANDLQPHLRKIIDSTGGYTNA